MVFINYQHYIYNYYDNSAHAIRNKFESSLYNINVLILDTNVNYFLNENKLLNYYNKFREYNYIHRDLLNKIERPLYRKTLYYNLNTPVNQLISNVTYTKILLNPERGLLYSNSWRLRKSYLNTFNKLTTYTPLANEEVIEYFSQTFLNKISTNNITSVTKYEEIIIKYYNNYYNSTEKYLEFIDDFNFLDDLDSNYYIVPIILYIGRHFINVISANP
jgi:hypothetical protein